MSVHHAISDHSKKQNQAIKRFMILDQTREHLIEEAVQRCTAGEPFSVERINRVTLEIQGLAKSEIVPWRVLVTEEMVKAYVERLKAQNKES